MCFNHSVIFCVAFSNMSLSGCKMTKSSAYRTKIGFISLYFIPSVIAVSIPCKAMLASNGEITPPCGVPASVGVNTSLSITPAFSHALMICLICGNVLSFFSSSSWLIASKVGSQPTRWHCCSFFVWPPPNRTCGFPSIRLSSNLLRDMVLHRFSILNSHMASFTDHKRFPSSCRHDLHPERLFFPAFPFEVFERMDVVNFNGSHCTADFTRIGQQPFDEFASGWWFSCGWKVLYLGFQVTLEWYASKSGDQWFLAFPFHGDFKTLAWSLGKPHRFLVFGTYPGNAR